jgi:hypothetical protein
LAGLDLSQYVRLADAKHFEGLWKLGGRRPFFGVHGRASAGECEDANQGCEFHEKYLKKKSDV